MDTIEAVPSGAAHRTEHRSGPARVQRALLLALLLSLAMVVWTAAQSTRVAVAIKLLETDTRLLERRPELLAEPARMAALQRSAARLQHLAGQQVRAQELLARVHFLLSRSSNDLREQIAHLRLARDALHLALARRSSWPYSWALLARIEFQLAPRGPAATIALRQALDLGLRGFNLQRQLLELRLLAEDRVDTQLQGRIRDSFLAGLREHGSELADQALALGRAEWVCSDAQARAMVDAWCVRIEGWASSQRR